MESGQRYVVGGESPPGDVDLLGELVGQTGQLLIRVELTLGRGWGNGTPRLTSCADSSLR
jgi:hypothetical protein